LATYQEIFERDPGREETLRYAARLATALGREELAEEYWRRSLKLNPWPWSAHFALAELLRKRQDWQQAIEECRAALRVNPADTDIRFFLTECYFRAGRKEEARKEFETLMALRPSDSEKLQKWFAEQMQSQ